MRISAYFLAALLLGTAALVGLHRVFAAGESRTISSASPRPELEYLKAVNSVAPPQDPQLLFLLMAQYSNANMPGEGAEFFSARLKEFGPRLTNAQKALYLTAIALLPAHPPPYAPPLSRI